jgi:predicted 3-demethylubiquinone-9 3-methyltransferase (glyoxalase superfamily)
MADQKIVPFFWFDGDAEEAVELYTSLFPNSRKLSESRYPEDSPGTAGSVMTISFELFGQEFVALNGGPEFKPNEAMSLMVRCDSQEEVDKYWNALTANGGEESMCGWLKDKFGFSWQITPNRLMELVSDPDKEKAQRAMKAMLEMRKIDIAKIEEAASAAGTRA